MKEYGGYFQLQLPDGDEYYPDMIALNSGRNALKYLIEARNIQKIYIPVFLCSAVRQACLDMKIEIEYYTIDHKLNPKLDGIHLDYTKNEYIYIVNYYGQTSRDEVICWKNIYQNIIFDCAQDFFFAPIKGIDMIYTCRKFFGVTDGAYLNTEVLLKRELEMDYSYDRVQYLLGRYEKCASEFYKDYIINENRIENLPLRKMSKLTHGLLRTINYDEVVTKRNNNAEYLQKRLGDSNELTVILKDGMYMYPYKCKNGDALRRKVQREKLFIPTLWNDTFDIRNTLLEKELVQNVLPIPMDQRYGIQDMKEVCDIIENNK